MIYQSIDKGEALWLTMSREAPSPTNDYADDDREWITEEVQIDELVMDAYMAYQARIWEGCKDIRGSREYNYNKTEAEVQEAWNAGYEMAARQYYGKYGGGPVRKETGIWPTHIAIGRETHTESDTLTHSSPANPLRLDIGDSMQPMSQP